MGFVYEITRPENRDALNRKRKGKYVEFLKETEIPYEEIDYKHPKVNLYKYIQNEIQNSNSHTIHSKRWILLTVKNFKESIMM